MRNLAFWILLVCLTTCNSVFPAHADPPPPPATQPLLGGVAGELQQAVTYLASDDLEGRGLNTQGINLAASYIAGSFHGAALKPLPGQSDYYQPFEISTLEGLTTDSLLRCGETIWKPNTDFSGFSSAPLTGAAEFSTPVVFAGYGVTGDAKQDSYDDYAGLDVKGKIVLIFRFEPTDGHGQSRFTTGAWSEHAHLATKIHNAAAHGAVAVLMMNPPNMEGPDALMSLGDRSVGGAIPIPFVQVKREIGAELLRRGGIADDKALQTSIDLDFKPHSQALAGVSVTGKIAMQRTPHKLKNVIGYLPGSGPHAEEYVVVGAHYDHLGRGEPGSLAPYSHAIHHGADDNASGSATVMELASLLADSSRQKPLDRSVIFMCFSGEERGLLGSQYFVSHPLLPLDKIVAMLNLDMVGRLRGDALDVGPSGLDPELQKLLDRADEGLPLKLKPMGRFSMAQWASDHASFANKRIPVLFLFTGLHADYHRPSDTADKINYQGMEQITELAERMIRDLTQMPAATLAAAGAKATPTMPGTGHAGDGGEAALGVVPDYGSDATADGVLITGTSPGSAAEAAGLKEQDRIIAFDDKKIENLQDLADALGEAKPGDKVKVKVLRGKETLVLDATLRARQ